MFERLRSSSGDRILKSENASSAAGCTTTSTRTPVDSDALKVRN